MDNEIANCKECGASAVLIKPTEWNQQSGSRVTCISKSCRNSTKEYKYPHMAIRNWNKQNTSTNG